MSGHTAGPWEVFSTGRGRVEVKSVYASPGMDDSQLYPASAISPGVNQEANARLIAAAPDLLEACKAIISECQLFNEGGSGEFVASPSLGSLEKMRAAIAKATR